MTKAEMAKRAKEAKRMHKLQQRMLSQAVQNMNIAFNFKETTGLS